MQQAIDAFSKGEPILVIDDEAEGALPMLALPIQSATREASHTFFHDQQHYIGICMPRERFYALGIACPSSEDSDRSLLSYRFGIEESPEVNWTRFLANEHLDVQRDGPFVPIPYSFGGALKCASPFEAAVDICQLAGLSPACAVSPLREDVHLGALPKVYLSEVVRHRRMNEKLLHRVATARIPTQHGSFQAVIFESIIDQTEHIALVKGEEPLPCPTLVRMHSECLTGDIFGSLRCDCGPQLDRSLALIAKEGAGVLVYLRGHEGRGIGLTHKLRAYELQEKGIDTVQANLELGLPVDKRDYGIGAQILRELGVSKIRLLTNNPRKYHGLAGYGLEIVERVSVHTTPNAENYRYLLTKKQKLGHHINIEEKEWEKPHADLPR